uniref:Uncharacterized protein n=1 Tax=Arundo donax TaxID=35708 RepID=A0A0A9GZR7_ARUDO
MKSIQLSFIFQSLLFGVQYFHLWCSHPPQSYDLPWEDRMALTEQLRLEFVQFLSDETI